MTRRYIHYEAAFEDYLRSRGLPYVAVDEHRKAIFAGTRVKSFDFIVYRSSGPHWLVDVKGRKFPYDNDGHKRFWENWVTADDIEGLTRWQEAFGDGFASAIIFAYHLTGADDSEPAAVARSLGALHTYAGEQYAFISVLNDDYSKACRQRSPRWDTVSTSARKLREMAVPLEAAPAGQHEHAEGTPLPGREGQGEGFSKAT